MGGVIQKRRLGDLNEDGMLYINKFNTIIARIGNTSFHINAPERLGTYEFLRNLALQVIETAELVDVQAEIDILRQNNN